MQLLLEKQFPELKIMPTPKRVAECIKSHHGIAANHGYGVVTSPQSVAQIHLNHGEDWQSSNYQETSLESAITGRPDIVYVVMETSIIVYEAFLQKENCLLDVMILLKQLEKSFCTEELPQTIQRWQRMKNDNKTGELLQIKGGGRGVAINCSSWALAGSGLEMSGLTDDFVGKMGKFQ